MQFEKGGRCPNIINTIRSMAFFVFCDWCEAWQIPFFPKRAKRMMTNAPKYYSSASSSTPNRQRALLHWQKYQSEKAKKRKNYWNAYTLWGKIASFYLMVERSELGSDNQTLFCVCSIKLWSVMTIDAIKVKMFWRFFLQDINSIFVNFW